jgi:hypothetical protein
MKGIHQAIVAFHTDTEANWRLSYIKLDKQNEEDLVEPLYRWSFLVGVGEPTKTLQDSTNKYLEDTKGCLPLVEDIAKIFTSMNAVTTDFYDNFLYAYETMKEDVFFINTKQNERALKLVMGQTVALFFLQKKGFLGVKEGDNWGTGDKNYLDFLTKYEGSSIYQEKLKPLLSALAGDEPIPGENIPILNGGLFEVQNLNSEGNTFDLPTEDYQDFVNMLRDFNFTISESDQYDKEVAVDPEMLGKIYQHILWVDEEGQKKKNGVVYTPTDIITYMCRESISEWLHKKLNNKVTKDDLHDLIELQELSLDLLKSQGREMYTKVINLKSIDYLTQIDTLLQDIKVLEPAVGSGGYLVGFMVEVTKLRKNIGILLYLIGEISKKDFLKYNDYELKLHAITHNLYGVDIDAGATDIAKLRTWLSLVVDMKEPTQLPNLDFRLVVGNSVVDRVDNTKMIAEISDLDLTDLEILKEDYTTKPHKQKVSMKQDIVDEMLYLLREAIPESKLGTFSISPDIEGEKDINVLEMSTQEHLDALFNRAFDYNLSFSEVMKQGGFDIVIGNPPYKRGNRIQKIKDELKYKFTTYHGSADLLIYFYEQGYNLLKEDGILAYITSNKWLTAKYGEKLRSLLAEKTQLLTVIDFKGNHVFPGIGVDTEITIFRKPRDGEKPNNNTLSYCSAELYEVQE